MRVSEYYNLGRSQATLEFLDVDINGDTRAFIDPRALRYIESPWARECVSLIQASVDGDVVQVQPDHRVVGGRRQRGQLDEEAGVDRLVATTAQRGGRDGLVGDALVAGPEHEGGDEVVEDAGVGDTGAVAAQGVGVGAGGFGDIDQGEELGVQGVKDGGWQGRHGEAFRSRSVSNPMVGRCPMGLHLQ